MKYFGRSPLALVTSYGTFYSSSQSPSLEEELLEQKQNKTPETALDNKISFHDPLRKLL